MRVVRIYHAGRDRAHRGRDRALAAAGVELTLVVPSTWPGPDQVDANEPFEVVAALVRRPGDVNRHRYLDPAVIARLIKDRRPDVVDIHEEPLSAVMHQLLGLLPPEPAVVGYAAQNLDKRYPPPFSGWERAAYGRLGGIYPCSRQAAAVLRGRGYRGEIAVTPLGVDEAVFHPGEQRHDVPELQLALIGRMVAEKGVRDAIAVLAEVRRHRPARLVLAGSGPELDRVAGYCAELGTSADVEVRTWVDHAEVAELCRSSHLVLVPSRSTSRWVEQFGRTIVEAQACGAVVSGYASGTIPEVAAGAAWLAAEGDVVGLSRAVVRFATDERGWTQLRNRGLSAASGKTWSQIATAQLALYDQAVGAGPVRPAPASGATRRQATAEFGPTARTADGQRRPFALPVLRDRPVAGRVLGGLVDVFRSVGRRSTEIESE